MFLAFLWHLGEQQRKRKTFHHNSSVKLILSKTTIIMKTLRIFFAVTLISFFGLSTVYASTVEGDRRTKRNEKIVAKYRTAIAEASTSDWELYTRAARICINRRINNQEALQWVEHAIEVNKNTYNVMVLGDYYYQKGEVLKAYKFYDEALRLGMFGKDKEHIDLLQRKIKKISEIRNEQDLS